MLKHTIVDAFPMSVHTDSTKAVAAGWYPDTTRPGWERLWDGSNWVDMARPARSGQVEPNPVRWHPDPHDPGQERLWSGDTWTSCTRQAKTHGRDSAAPPRSYDAEAAKETKYADLSKPKKLATLGTVASVLLIFTILANLALLVANQRYIGLESEVINGGVPDFTQLRSAIDDANTASDVSGVSVLIAAVGFIAWFSRAYRNLPRRGAVDLRFGPGWAIGAWFVPILNLFRPKQIANDIWRGSDRPADHSSVANWKERRVAPLLHWWWGWLLLGSALGRVSAMSIADANNSVDASLDTLRDERTALYLDQAASVALIVAAILAIQVIKRISSMQDGNPSVEGAVHASALTGDEAR